MLKSHDMIQRQGSVRVGLVWGTAVLLLLSIGCGGHIYPVYPATSGFHAPGDTFGLGHTVNGRFTPSKPETVVIWSTNHPSQYLNNPQVDHHLAGVLLRDGYTVVERARLQQIFDEQKVRLLHTSDREADVLRVGRIAGATLVIFVELQHEPFLDPEVKSASVGIRGVHVETGQVRWSGTARMAAPGRSVFTGGSNGVLVYLAELALRRATCPVEAGFEWIEPSDSDYAGGCRQRKP